MKASEITVSTVTYSYILPPFSVALLAVSTRTCSGRNQTKKSQLTTVSIEQLSFTLFRTCILLSSDWVNVTSPASYM